MNTWYSKDIGDGNEARQPSNQIKEVFFLLSAAAGNPIEMAVFSRYDLESNVITVYFSPAAVKLAEAFSATPCEKPSFKHRPELLVGDQRSIATLFPETQK
jgi:hypothetical protein